MSISELIARLLKPLGRHSTIDETSRVIRLGRDFYRYEEGDRWITLQIDMQSGDPQRVIYKSTMLGVAPTTARGSVLTPAEQDRVATRIASHLRSQGLSVEIED